MAYLLGFKINCIDTILNAIKNHSQLQNSLQSILTASICIGYSIRLMVQTAEINRFQ